MSPTVTVLDGTLKGAVHKNSNGFEFNVFLGIPYAKPPVGNLRFRDPQLPEKWTGTRDATIQGEINAQYNINKKIYLGDEDSLFLNVSVPSSATPESKLPVMCYIHGGGFYLGNGTFESLRPDYLVEKDIVVVTFNYRLGILGFMCLHTPEVPGNAGLKDQVFVLRWIQKNIKFFGGDPQKVTIVGDSAGSACVHYHMMSPMSKGLFVGAIMESGACISEWAKQKDPEMHAFKIAEKLGMEKTSSKEELLKFLRNVPVKDLATKSIIDFDFHMDIWFCGVVETKFPDCEAFLVESPEKLIESGNYNVVPSIHGMCSHEALLFMTPTIFDALEKGEFVFTLDDVKILMKKHTMIDVQADDLKKVRDFYIKDEKNLIPGFIDFVSDMFFTRDIVISVKKMRMHSDSVFHYLYGFYGKLNRLPSTTAFTYDGAGHADDDSYIFKHENDDIELGSSDLMNRKRMVAMWTNFVKFGNPTPQKDDNITEIWKPVTKDKLHCLEIKNELKMLENPFSERHVFLDSILSKYKK